MLHEKISLPIRDLSPNMMKVDVVSMNHSKAVKLCESILNKNNLYSFFNVVKDNVDCK